MNEETNIELSKISKQDRWRLNQHKSGVIWFTGLSGSGKSTLANEMDKRFYQMGIHSCLLDGDALRFGLNKDLGFSRDDRKENIRRAGEISKMMADAGLLVLASFISPYQSDRDMVRSMFSPGEFFEIYVQCPLEICQNRDPKGLYKKAQDGSITEFTGLTSPYFPPEKPELVIPTDRLSVMKCADMLITYLGHQSFLLENPS
ncbi:adenylyl-sulfate kinase [Brevibacillus centrosporus]|uniref:adenylyl-sulfate kinase n=1 Tax=Brevibacillus centrosporus TaxID=54910 RepID=UPI00381F20E8